MARLTTEPVAPEDILAVITTPQLKHAAKAVWMYLRVTADPPSQRAIAEALHMDEGTVSRLVRALEAKGLARKANGVWLPELER
ncbi:MarR family transcriptional regulator [Streptomyces sp. NPDC057438]|uniref:MarR family transcriptional regulator n=1 Tax=Streptomyces sp. NPDC057438 TaxID=3346133 RepID=UPI0036A84A25